MWYVGSSVITCVIIHIANPKLPGHRLGRIWKCYDRVKNFYFVLGFWYGSGCAYGALDQARGLIGGRGCIYVGMRGWCTSILLAGKQRDNGR